jgi:hypothetical protein
METGFERGAFILSPRPQVTYSQKQRTSVDTMENDLKHALLRWIDSEAGIDGFESGGFEKTVDWPRIIPFVSLHLGCLGVLWVGLSTVAVWTSFILFYATCTINSLDYMFGTRRFDTPDTSRNNALLALITLGEGWHNNHHHYPVSATQGIHWWEIDITYMLLKLLDRVGIVRDLRPLPERLRSG